MVIQVIREYKDCDFNIVNVLGRDIDINYKFNLSPVSKCFVYEKDNNVIGFILIDLFDDRSEVIDIVVDVMFRNNKIGDQLLKYIIELSKNNGCNNITLEVSVNNKVAIKLYSNNHFKTISIRKRYYSNGNVDAYVMQRKL